MGKTNVTLNFNPFVLILKLINQTKQFLIPSDLDNNDKEDTAAAASNPFGQEAENPFDQPTILSIEESNQTKNSLITVIFNLILPCKNYFKPETIKFCFEAANIANHPELILSVLDYLENDNIKNLQISDGDMIIFLILWPFIENLQGSNDNSTTNIDDQKIISAILPFFENLKVPIDSLNRSTLQLNQRLVQILIKISKSSNPNHIKFNFLYYKYVNILMNDNYRSDDIIFNTCKNIYDGCNQQKNNTTRQFYRDYLGSFVLKYKDSLSVELLTNISKIDQNEFKNMLGDYSVWGVYFLFLMNVT